MVIIALIVLFVVVKASNVLFCGSDLNDELSLENAVAFLRQQQEENAKFRGPLLAQLEFYRLAKLHNMPVTGLPEGTRHFKYLKPYN